MFGLYGDVEHVRYVWREDKLGITEHIWKGKYRKGSPPLSLRVIDGVNLVLRYFIDALYAAYVHLFL